MPYRFKERPAYRFLGEEDDLLYSAVSGYENISTGHFDDPAYHLDRYSYYCERRATAVYCPSELGAEQISWVSNGDGKYNPCTHLRTRIINVPFGACFRKYNLNTAYYWLGYYRFKSPAYYPYSLGILQHPTIDIQAARARAWNNMQPRFEGKISLINFLYELKDFRDIVKYLFKKEKFIKDIRKVLNKGKRPILAPKDPTRGIATAILVNNFAIQPLIKDISAMMQQANIIVREAQQKFFESGSEYQTSHYTEEINRVDSRTLGTGNYYWTGSGYLEFTLFTATLKYKYDYTMRNTIDAWMKYWGLCGSFEAWWNMIPFSFLVDYFVQIGNSIHAMEHDPKVHLTEYEYGESLKTTFFYGTSTNGDPRHDVLVLDGNVLLKAKNDRLKDRLLAGIEGSIYTRRPCMPYYGPATPRLRLPSTRQTLNIAALLRCLL